jgi:hypothetical protein
MALEWRVFATQAKRTLRLQKKKRRQVAGAFWLKL